MLLGGRDTIYVNFKILQSPQDPVNSRMRSDPNVVSPESSVEPEDTFFFCHFGEHPQHPDGFPRSPFSLSLHPSLDKVEREGEEGSEESSDGRGG